MSNGGLNFLNDKLTFMIFSCLMISVKLPVTAAILKRLILEQGIMEIRENIVL